MSKNLKPLTQAQRRANARNQLYRQIHGYNLDRFVNVAIRENALTGVERILLEKIRTKLNTLKEHQFENSKAVGLNPRRRCAYCNNIAHYRATVFGTEKYLCNKHKEIADRNNKQNSNGDWMVTDIHEINPYE